MLITFAIVVRLRPTIYQNAQNSEENLDKGICSTIFFQKKTPLNVSISCSKIKHPLFFFQNFCNFFFCNCFLFFLSFFFLALHSSHSSSSHSLPHSIPYLTLPSLKKLSSFSPPSVPSHSHSTNQINLDCLYFYSLLPTNFYLFYFPLPTLFISQHFDLIPLHQKKKGS